MIIYNITFHVDKDIRAESIQYLKEKFLPSASASGFLQQGCLRRVLHTPEEEGCSYAVQFHVKNMDTLQYWLDTEGNQIHAELVNRFGSKIAGFTTLLEEIDWEQ